MRVSELLIAAMMVACTPTNRPAPPTTNELPPAEPTEQPPAPPVTETPPTPAGGGTLLADGEACRAGTDCTSGVCEGQGCTDQQLGRCAPRQRACTRDLRTYCGCDGQVFQSSGSCPGRRYQSAGACSGGAP